MRRSLLALSLLCLLTLPLAAHADQIDDFVLAGMYDNGTPFQTITFSAQASGFAFVNDPNTTYSETFIYIFNLNGHPGPDYFLTEIPPETLFFGPGASFPVAPGWLTFSGDLLGSDPTYTFHPGSYASSYSAYMAHANLTLTITPESTTTPSPIPEPTPLLLVATGLLSCATLGRRKLLCRSATSIK